MSEPRRWLDEGSGVSLEVRRLLEAGRKPQPMTSRQFARSLENIERLETMSMIPMRSLFGRRVTKGGLVFAIILLAALAAAATPAFSRFFSQKAPSPHSFDPKAPTLPAANPTAKSIPRDPASSLPPEKVDTQIIAPPMPTSVNRRARENALAPAPVLPEQPSSTNAPAEINEQKQFEEEVHLLDEARALRVSNPNRALELLDDHRIRFPRGKLSHDRALLTIDALRHAGRTNEARARALELLERAKGKPHEEKLRGIVESLP